MNNGVSLIEITDRVATDYRLNRIRFGGPGPETPYRGCRVNKEEAIQNVIKTIKVLFIHKYSISNEF